MSDQIGNPKVKGKCPMGCGETLFLGNGGYVTCSLIGCQDPAAAHKLLSAHHRVTAAVHVGPGGSAVIGPMEVTFE